MLDIADTGSITGGAERSKLSLPAAIGKSLFARNNRDVTPTAAGEALLHHERVVVLLIDAIHQAPQPRQ